MADKNELRIQAKNIRKNLNMKEISARLADLVRHNDIYISAKNVMLFYPMEFEVDLRELFNDDKNFYLPKVEGAELLVCPYICRHGNADLKKSSLGIYEPCSKPVNPEVLDLVIVPALLCDANGYRLGYGGGFYDKFISQYGTFFRTLCAIPNELYTRNLPSDEYDQRIDIIIRLT